jgi:hypothetical protein
MLWVKSSYAVSKALEPWRLAVCTQIGRNSVEDYLRCEHTEGFLVFPCLQENAKMVPKFQVTAACFAFSPSDLYSWIPLLSKSPNYFCKLYNSTLIQLESYFLTSWGREMVNSKYPAREIRQGSLTRLQLRGISSRTPVAVCFVVLCDIRHTWNRKSKLALTIDELSTICSLAHEFIWCELFTHE